jgi:hypothetical protein
MMQHVGPDRVGNVSFWCRRNAKHPPFYLCDSDIVIEIAASAIIGLAFVFHESDNVVRQLDGLANTYIVTSIYLSQSMKVEHTRSFCSFPSQVHEPLPTCFSSITKMRCLCCSYNARIKRRNVTFSYGADHFFRGVREFN